MECFVQILIIIILTYFVFNLTFTSPKYIYKHTLTKHSFANNKYFIFTINNVLLDEECSVIINTARPKLKRSTVISNNNVSNIRTSQSAFLRRESSSNDPVLIKLLEKLDNMAQRLSGKPLKNQEPLQVVKYDKNQEYKPHYDCCVPLESTLCKADAQKHGYRHSTFLVYLNDVEKGGETEFPLINYKFVPKKGTAIFFLNLTPNEQTFHELSKHAGLPPLIGEKWICNKWIRTRKYNQY
ncbi:putative prolyl 4-hydroxylase [Pyramimonas orientalis virus]|uniref:Prolyl 4-hydroxylase n=1 Tax=Pyramimonas orientalis virus 01B TaxID=3134525 RepID=A0A7L9AYJ0_9VIRU|nr:putative prolyl 4-hydroxylase [Pyramimonas orientalis virus]QOI90270.1 putative prolyl 4-hydroxylase [Pyramimonas orientalis virus]